MPPKRWQAANHYKQKTMKPNLIKGITENVSYNYHNNIELAVMTAIFQRTDSRNDRFRLSDKQFRRIFQICPSFFLFEYGEKARTLIGKYYDDSESMYFNYLAIWEFCAMLTIFDIRTCSCKFIYE